MAQQDKSKNGNAAAEPPKPPTSPLGVLREWSDALVIAFLLAMFIRTFVVELFKIPSGSMTPTLIGTSANSYDGQSDETVIEWDVDGNGEKDLILDRRYRRADARYNVFYRENGKFVRNEEVASLNLPIEALRKARVRNDRIIVNKFIYWFRPPRRGEIVVFRVPPGIYERDKPIFIKRVVGLPGDTVEIHEPSLFVNGEKVTDPEVFRRNEYVERFQGAGRPPYRPAYIETVTQGYWESFVRAKVPEYHYLVFGDNSRSSRDGRDWGAVHEDAVKGKAVFRYWPIKTWKFLE